MTRARYGYDAPGVTIGFFAAALACTVAAGAILMAGRSGLAIVAAGVLGLVGGVALVLGCAMLAYFFGGKVATRALMLDTVSWRGDERVLDVGTGRGFLLVGAARRVPRGRVVGIDVWRAGDLSGNGKAAALANATLEAVGERVEVLDQDATKMPFPDASFEVVLSLLCIHNIEPVHARETALRHMARVLAPGGQLVIGDYVGAQRYAQVLADAGLRVEVRPALAVARSLMWLVVARKP